MLPSPADAGMRAVDPFLQSLETTEMRVDPKDGTCRNCKGTLTIIDADDATITVMCDECGDVYVVETDAFNDGAMIYYPEFMASRVAEERD
ncbi:MAG TPA: hypothetical protein VFI31_18390 [Pirellulales bacterium]|nr:hypothetical protein [Pirellulales bacterium]